MQIGKDEISGMIPHAGAMCLLEGVLDWDRQRIRCLATNHRSADNPLAVDGALHAVCGLEYAAQAMALHGVLSGVVGPLSRAGYIVSVRDMAWRTERLDRVPEDLTIEAELLAASDALVSYRFTLSASDGELVSGRAVVILQAQRS